jgi:hypothetical protein
LLLKAVSLHGLELRTLTRDQPDAEAEARLAGLLADGLRPVVSEVIGLADVLAALTGMAGEPGYLHPPNRWRSLGFASPVRAGSAPRSKPCFSRADGGSAAVMSHWPGDRPGLERPGNPAGPVRL